MKNINHLLIILIFIFLKGCSQSSSIPDGSANQNSDENLYLITQNGNLSELSEDVIDTEYDTFFFVGEERRAIYIGGKLPTQNQNNYNVVWLESNSDSPTERIVNNINDSQIQTINGENFYSVQFLLQPSVGNHNVNLNVGNLSGTNLISYANKSISLQVSGDLYSRDWGLRVYQQQNYNALDNVRNDIVRAFGEMNVYFGYNGNNIINVNNNLPNQTFNYDFSNILPINEDPGVIYAFSRIYGEIPIDQALMSFWNEHPNEGLLFFVQNYNPINAQPLNYIFGYTRRIYFNGDRILSPISFIFVQRIRDIVANNWEDEEISTTTIHELGHLWCADITNEVHTSWHNGNNRNMCSLNYFDYNSDGEPQGDGDRILTLRGFCEGHLQRGMNISWRLRQYSPYGENTTPLKHILFALNNEQSIYRSDSIKIELMLSKNEFFQGESINILCSVFNQSAMSVYIGGYEHHLLNLNTGKLYNSRENYSRRSQTGIPAFSIEKSIIDPHDWLMSDEYIGNPFPSGTYEYWLTEIINDRKIVSNKVRFTILEPPDSVKPQLNELIYLSNKSTPLDEAKSLYEKYKNSFYSERALKKLLSYPNLETTLKLKLTKQYIISYPNSSKAVYLFLNLLGNHLENRILLEEIIENLKRNQPDCYLLEVLRSWPDNLDTKKQIRHLLY